MKSTAWFAELSFGNQQGEQTQASKAKGDVRCELLLILQTFYVLFSL